MGLRMAAELLRQDCAHYRWFRSVSMGRDTLFVHVTRAPRRLPLFMADGYAWGYPVVVRVVGKTKPLKKAKP